MNDFDAIRMAILSSRYCITCRGSATDGCNIDLAYPVLATCKNYGLLHYRYNIPERINNIPLFTR